VPVNLPVTKDDLPENQSSLTIKISGLIPRQFEAGNSTGSPVAISQGTNVANPAVQAADTTLPVVVAQTSNVVAATPTQTNTILTVIPLVPDTTSGSKSASSTSPAVKATGTLAPTPLSPPQIVGITFGGLVALGCFVWILWYFFLRMRKNLQSGYHNVPDPDQDELLYNEASVGARSRTPSNRSEMTETIGRQSLSSPLAERY